MFVNLRKKLWFIVILAYCMLLTIVDKYSKVQVSDTTEDHSSNVAYIKKIKKARNDYELYQTKIIVCCTKL